MNSNPYSFVFIGRSGCGKGTQADLLKKYLESKFGADSVFYVYTGAHLRELTSHPEFFTAKMLHDKVLGPGEKAPDGLAIWACVQELIHGAKENDHVIVGGSPRTASEAAVLDEMFDFLNRKKIFHIWLSVSAEWAREKMMARGRSDDNAENIKRRLAYYEKHVLRAIEFYKKDASHRFLEINGEQSIEQVHRDIVKALAI